MSYCYYYFWKLVLWTDTCELFRTLTTHAVSPWKWYRNQDSCHSRPLLCDIYYASRYAELCDTKEISCKKKILTKKRKYDKLESKI